MARAQDPKNRLCLLSLDGGGVRGLSSLRILRAIMERVNQGREDTARLRPCQVMDVIGGTSTGGLIAIMLGRLGMDVDECIEKYTSMFAGIFGDKAHHVKVGWSGDIRSMFKSDALRTAITKAVMDCGLPADAKFNDGNHRDCHTFVCATAAESSNATRLRDYDLPGKPKDRLGMTIVEAALATSAASTFFDRVQIGDRYFRDGATGANNPIDDVWIEAENIWNDDEEIQLQDMIACLLSIGTGNPGMKPFQEKSWKFLTETLVKIASDTEQKAEKFEHVHRVLLRLSDKRYYRFNVEQGLQEVGLEEYRLTGQIETATEEYLAKRTQENEIRACAQILKFKDSGALPFTRKPEPVILTEQESICLQSLYTSDYRQHKERNPKRVPGTCEWFLEHPKYLDWINTRFSDLLWVSADAGCGKSVLASFLVDRISTEVSDRDTTVCYFFFKDDNTEQRSSSSAFCAMVHQVLTHDVTLVKHAMAQYQLKGPSYFKYFTNLWDILVSITSDDLHGRNVICILDGLDECEKSNRLQMIQYLANFYSRLVRSPDVTKFFLKFLITSRPSVLVEDTFSDLPTIRLKAEDETTAISRDIEFVVEDAVASIARQRNLPLDKQNALIKQIVGNADRTFLWVKLVLQRIQSSALLSKAAIQDLVETVPSDLDDFYSKILSESSESRHTRKVLEIVVGALRPLSLSELNVAFVIQPTNKSQQDLDLEPDIERTVKRLCGVFLRVIDSSVYLAHQTAREFLLKLAGPTPGDESDRAVIGPWKHSFYPKDISETWAQICRWHLMFTVFEEYPLFIAPEPNVNLLKGKVEEYTNQYTLLSYTARFWPDHLRNWGTPHNDPSLELFLPLYKPESQRFKTWYQIYWVAVYNWSLGPTENTPLIVAAYFGHTEVCKKLLSSHKTVVGRLGLLFVKEEDDPVNAKDEDGMSSLTWAAQNGHLETVRYLLEQRNIDANCRDSLLRTPLIRAASKGNFEIVKVLLSRSDIIADAQADRWETALACAADNGHYSIVQLLMDRQDVNINNKDRYGETPLFKAVRNGSVEIVRALLARSEIYLELEDSRTSLLSAAAANGDEEILQIVLKLAENSDKGFNLGAAITNAAKNGNTAVLQKLLGLDTSLLNVRNDETQTPLSLAAMWGYIETTRFLLTQPDVDINTIDKYQRTPLALAIDWSGGTVEIVDMLLACDNINVNHQDTDGDTPLTLAARAGKEQICQSLIRHRSVDINRRSKTQWTPLMWAASGGYLAIVKLLLACKNIEIDAKDDTGMTAVAWAAYTGHTETLRLLIDKGADYNLANNRGLTPFKQAANQGHREAMKVLAQAELRAE